MLNGSREDRIRELSGGYSGAGQRIGVVVSRFNEFITKSLLSGCVECLVGHGVSDRDIEVVWVPGALELGLAVSLMAKSGKFDAIIALGAVIRGETAHFDVVVNQSAAALTKVSETYLLPVLNGVLTTEDLDQAISRAGAKSGNKGFDVALAAIEMVNISKDLSKTE